VAFAQRLASEGCFDPTRVWTVTDLVELMIVILQRDDLRIHEDPKDHTRWDDEPPGLGRSDDLGAPTSENIPRRGTASQAAR
jgi:hypothetical protein